jgi:hypothetical protein
MYEAIAELGRFFRDVCAKTLRKDVLRRMEVEIVIILCKLEVIFPFAVHLPREALLRGLFNMVRCIQLKQD